MADVKDKHEIVQAEAEKAIALERSLAEATDTMMQIPEFRDLLEKQKTGEKQLKALWAGIEQLMIENDVKSIKGDWGSLTIVDKINWSGDVKKLPAEFVKTVPDTTSINNHFKLTGETPAGAVGKPIKYLMKKLKLNKGEE